MRDCCQGASLGRKVSKLTPSVVPAVLLLLLPKCPMCLAAWLTLATGLSFSAAGATWAKVGIAVFTIGQTFCLIFTSANANRSRGPISMYLMRHCARLVRIVGGDMDRCCDDRQLSELDPVTFFIVTEVMRAEREQLLTRLQPQTIELGEDFLRQVA